MYKVTAYFKDQKIVKYFLNLYDAIDFRDTADAHYPKKVIFEEGVNPMRTWVIECWNAVMDDERNPLSNIPDLNTRHLIMQVLAWMWCIAFAIIVGSWTAFGVSAIIHVVLLGAICVTVATFETAKRKPTMFDLRPGYHSVSRTRQTMWIDGKKIQLDKNDPGGEHE
jgi:hypothetical protein